MQSLDDRIAMLEKKKSLSLKTFEQAPKALAQVKTAVKTAAKKPKKDMFAEAFEDENIYSQIPNESLVQIKFVEDFDENTQEYKDPEVVKDEGEMVVATA
jgi:predicted  nucleic acid-binding Zn-ribbon protein